MTELSLNILDLAQNSVKAGAARITIAVEADSKADTLWIHIEDNGCGMTAEQVSRVTDPFFTTRTTRKVGLGVPFFKMAAEMTGGTFGIESTPGVGTKVSASFGLSHIDRMPLGDMGATLSGLIGLNEQIEFIYRYTVDGESFTLETQELKAILDGVSLGEPEVMAYIREYINDNTKTIGGGAVNL